MNDSEMSEVIRDVMESEEAFPEEIPNRTARQGVRGFSEVKCVGCARSWSTHRAHVVINLKEQRVDKIYKQKCKSCQRENELTFREMEFRGLVEKAIEQENKFRNSAFRDEDDHDDDDDGGGSGPPHESSLCEKCEYGRTQCWKKRKSCAP